MLFQSTNFSVRARVTKSLYVEKVEGLSAASPLIRALQVSPPTS